MLLLVFLLFPSSSWGYQQYLFSGMGDSAVGPTAKIIDLDRGSLDRIKARGEPWAVMFYSPTCGHCQQFAPVWADVWGVMEAAGVGVKLGAVSCVADGDLCQDENVHGYPTLKAFGLPAEAEGTKEGEGVVITNQKKAALITWLKDRYSRKEHQSVSVSVDDDGGSSAPATAAARKGQSSSKTRTQGQKPEDLEEEDGLSLPALRQARVEDAFTSLRFALDHDIFLGAKVLTDDVLGSLKDLLHVLSLLFPGKARRQALRGLLEEVYPLEELGIAEWESYLAAHLDHLVPMVGGKKDYQWRICRRDAGYTCGLWILFHLLTVKSAVTEANGGASSSTSIISPPYVMKVVHGFVSHFFGCEDCREHFLKAYESVRGRWEGQGGRGAVLWVYDLHDKVNVRLEKRRWPSACEDCWQGEEPNMDKVHSLLLEAYNVHDSETLNNSGGGILGDKGSVKELASVMRDYLVVIALIFVMCVCFCLKLEAKFRTGQRKKRDHPILPR